MKRQNWLLSVAILLLVTMLLTGCVGRLFGESPEAQIRRFLKQVETAMKAQDAQKLANSFTYPIEEKNDEGEIRVVYEDEDALKKELEKGFAGMSDGDITIVDFRFDLAKAEIIVEKSGDSAVIEKATVVMALANDGEPITLPPPEDLDFELKKVGKQWKFDSNCVYVFGFKG